MENKTQKKTSWFGLVLLPHCAFPMLFAVTDASQHSFLSNLQSGISTLPFTKRLQIHIWPRSWFTFCWSWWYCYGTLLQRKPLHRSHTSLPSLTTYICMYTNREMSRMFVTRLALPTSIDSFRIKEGRVRERNHWTLAKAPKRAMPASDSCVDQTVTCSYSVLVCPRHLRKVKGFSCCKGPPIMKQNA